MRQMTLRNSRIIADNELPYIIAEVNTSHFGNMSIAKSMIKAAKDAGSDCVKFQSWTPESINSKTFYDDNPIANRIFKKFSLSPEQLADLFDFSRSIKIDFSSTPYSREEADFLINECGAPFIKVASMDLNNYDYLSYIAKAEIPIILSTGMADAHEIHKAVKVIEDAGGKNLSLLHCISIYPAEASTIRLRNINGLREQFVDYPIGFSDHSTGIEMASASIALGANIIEKHMTLDKTKIGMDNQIALEPSELKKMVENCKNVFQALGDTRRFVSEAEKEQRLKIRRSIISKRELKAGNIITKEDLDTKRPGSGYSPEFIKHIIGRKLKCDLPADIVLMSEHFE